MRAPTAAAFGRRGERLLALRDEIVQRVRLLAHEPLSRRHERRVSPPSDSFHRAGRK